MRRNAENCRKSGTKRPSGSTTGNGVGSLTPNLMNGHGENGKSIKRGKKKSGAERLLITGMICHLLTNM